MQTLNTPWYKQHSLMQFINQNSNPDLLEELQTQQEICQATLGDTPVNSASYTLTPDGDCIITLTLNTSLTHLLELADRQINEMMQREFIPNKINLLFN